MKIPIDKIPYSAYGSYFAISRVGGAGDIYLRDVHGGDEVPSRLYRLRLKGHSREEITLCCTETQLIIESRKVQGGKCLMIIAVNSGVHILTKGVSLELAAVGKKYDTLVPISDHTYEHHFYGKQIKVKLTCVYGKMEQKQSWNVTGSEDAQISLGDGIEETYVVLESFKSVLVKKNYPDFDQVKRDTQLHLEKWKNMFYNRSRAFEKSFELASYLTWANIVHSEGLLSADAMYMTKNTMYNIWSWDNCFGAIALSAGFPELAYGQLKIFIDQQDESGCYPDFVNETFASYNCVKPPIHGWAYDKMIAINPVFKSKGKLSKIYKSLCKVTEFWLHYRVPEGGVFPVYYHGNDSGWDNASVFSQGVPVESPDLAALLICQMDKLSKWAIQLNRDSEGAAWKEKADAYYHNFVKHFYSEGRLKTFYVPTKEVISGTHSLLPYMSLIIADRMEGHMVDALVKNLLEVFEQEYGLATEAPGSSYYQKAGYWLGPVWAPVTYMLIDALRANGYGAFAQRLANKFCKATTIGMMSENYDPFTGEGYDDPGFSWSSCVLLRLLMEYDHLEE